MARFPQTWNLISSDTHNPTGKSRWQQFRPKDKRDEITKLLNEWDEQNNKEVKCSPRRTWLLTLVEQSSDSSLATCAATFASAELVPSDLKNRGKLTLWESFRQKPPDYENVYECDHYRNQMPLNPGISNHIGADTTQTDKLITNTIVKVLPS